MVRPVLGLQCAMAQSLLLSMTAKELFWGGEPTPRNLTKYLRVKPYGVVETKVSLTGKRRLQSAEHERCI